ncbi:MAG: hypothetical protein PHS96_06210 [Anaerolineales bacterium]|nr:hypothetical protein [Anaerolineales bacterium]
MAETPNERHALPYRTGRILFQALEEVLGCSRAEAVFAHLSPSSGMGPPSPEATQAAFPLEVVGAVQATLEQAYGLRGGQGLALRAGRASFKYGLRAFGAELGLFDLPFRLLPLMGKLQASAAALGEALATSTGSAARLEEHGDGFTWRLERCPACWQRHASEPSCHLLVGFLQEGLYWLSGGKSIQVAETTCLAAGDSACAFSFDLRPAE